MKVIIGKNTLGDSSKMSVSLKEYGRSTHNLASAWRAHYPNDGTIYQQGQDFKEKTINEMTPRAKEIYAEKIKEGLGL